MKKCPWCKQPTKNKDFIKKGSFGPWDAPIVICKKCRAEHNKKHNEMVAEIYKRDRKITGEEVWKNLQEKGTK